MKEKEKEKKKKGKRMGKNPLSEAVPDMTGRKKKKSTKRDKNKAAKEEKKIKRKYTKKKTTKEDNKQLQLEYNEESQSTSYWPKVGFRFRPDLMDDLKWAVFCTKKNQQTLMNEALEAYIKSLNLPKKPKLD